MDKEIFEQILGQHSFGVAFLSSDFTVVRHNSHFNRFTVDSGMSARQPFSRLFPEAVGLEEILEEIAAGKRISFMLENILRETPDGTPLYFNMCFYHLDSSQTPVLGLLEDVTRKALLQQHVTHQQNEIRLLESLLSSYSHMSPKILGRSESIRRVKAAVEKIATLPSSTVLLRGESGTGKSMIARLIHHLSSHADAPFVEINCAAIPDTLLESELFGYEKGAFTHATESKPGLLEAADGGTLFLDEIGDMPLSLQAKLLSFLETWRFRRLGSTEEKEIRVRLITATNRDLFELVKENKFREDLFYRLNVVFIDLPPLREMGEDVLEIADHFIRYFNLEFKKHVKGFTREARQKLLHYQWRGNVRELRNAIERAMIFAEGDMLDAQSLLLGSFHTTVPETSPIDAFRLPPEGLPFEEIEKKLLQDALKLSNGNQSRAAQLLRLSRDTFRYRLEKYQLI